MELGRAFIKDYSINEKGSVAAEPMTREYPGHGALTALDIKTIYVEMKTLELRKIKIGMDVSFLIDQDISLSEPNYKTKEYDDKEVYVKGSGSGEIIDIQDLDLSQEDEETQEIKIILKNGYAEDL